MAALVNTQYQQVSENDPAMVVLTHKPSLEIWSGSIHPSSSLYETGVCSEGAVKAHEAFVDALRGMGVPRVLTISDVLASAAHERLVQLAAESLAYEFRGNPSGLDRSDMYAFSEDYKIESLTQKSADELVSIILTRPTVVVNKDAHEECLIAESVSLRPLSNLVFVRDQQIVTARGLVMGNLHNPQRKAERRLLELCFDILGIPRIGYISGDATLEGGDFIPFNEDMAFLGVGIRTNQEAARQLLKRDFLGVRRLAVVVDALDRRQKRMHLDTVFNVVDEKTVIVWEPIITDPTKRRFVDLYVQQPDRRYVLEKSHVDFVEFLRSEGLKVIPATEEEQTDYLINFLNLGRKPNGNIRILSIHPGLGDKLKENGVTGVEVQVIDYRGITRMYGGAHCSSQVFRCHNPDSPKEVTPPHTPSGSLPSSRCVTPATMRPPSCSS